MDSIIWNKNFAYGIGLIATDGNLSPDKRHIELTSKDLELIINIKKSFKLKNKIGTKTRGSFPYRQYYRIQFGNVKLYNFLLAIGLSPSKSHTIGALRIPKKFLSDFLRGVIDGDGAIDYFWHPESKEKQFRIRITSASKKFLKWLKNKINKLLDINGVLRRGTKAYELCFYKEASHKLVDLIYYRKNILFLKRKFEIAKLLKREGGGTGTRVSLRS